MEDGGEEIMEAKDNITFQQIMWKKLKQKAVMKVYEFYFNIFNAMHKFVIGLLLSFISLFL